MNNDAHVPPLDRKELFRGRAAHSTELLMHGLGGLLGIGGLVLAVVLLVFTSGILSLLGLLLSCVGGGFVLAAWLRVISVSYRVDTFRVEVERGILRKHIDNVELWRVKDIQFRQSLVQRVLGLGDVVLVTSDALNPSITLRGVREPRALYGALRDAVDAVRRGRGVLGVESA